MSWQDIKLNREVILVYKWANKVTESIMPVPAQIVGERCEKIRTQHNGRLTKEDVLEDAKKATSPLHKIFEWNDSVAGEKYRLQQAQAVIQNIVITVTGTKDATPVRAFVSVKQGEYEPRSYTSISAAMQDPELRQQVLERAYKELQSWKARYEQYEELADIIQVIDAKVPVGASVAA